MALYIMVERVQSPLILDGHIISDSDVEFWDEKIIIIIFVLHYMVYQAHDLVCVFEMLNTLNGLSLLLLLL